MPQKLFEIKFDGIDELIKLAEQQAELLRDNIAEAVADATLFGINKIANDCPVDTGRLRASIAGDYGDQAEVDVKRGRTAEGKALSATKIDRLNMEGCIGTDVEYALHVEYGVKGIRKKLTYKQLRYLFAKGILRVAKRGKKTKEGQVIYKKGDLVYKYKPKGERGKGFFRKNIPLIQNHFNLKMNEAIEATKEGRSLGRFKGD